MRRNSGISLLAAVLVAGAVFAVAGVVFVTVSVFATPTMSGSASAPVAVADDEQAERGDRTDEDDGPPPWAQAHGQGHGNGHGHTRKNQAWKDAWAELTPAQKRARMAEMVRAHERGMAAWADCVDAAGGDRSQQAQCEKPLPPGLARKQKP